MVGRGRVCENEEGGTGVAGGRRRADDGRAVVGGPGAACARTGSMRLMGEVVCSGLQDGVRQGARGVDLGGVWADGGLGGWRVKKQFVIFIVLSHKSVFRLDDLIENKLSH